MPTAYDHGLQAAVLAAREARDDPALAGTVITTALLMPTMIAAAVALSAAARPWGIRLAPTHDEIAVTAFGEGDPTPRVLHEEHVTYPVTRLTPPDELGAIASAQYKATLIGAIRRARAAITQAKAAADLGAVTA